MFQKFIKIQILSFISLVLMSCAVTDDQSTRVYQGVILEAGEKATILDPYLQSIKIDRVSGVIHYGRGVKMQMVKCDNKEWDCISDGNIEFSIPKTWSHQTKSWSYRGIDYSIISGQYSNVLISEPNYYFVMASSRDSNRAKKNNIFFYSKESGVIGFVIHMAGMNDQVVPVVYVRQN